MSMIALRYRLDYDGFCLDVAADIPEQGVTGIFGASGSGKTTLLRCIAGLEPTTDSTPVHKRRIGYVFQQPQLFPHMDVEANIRYGMKRSRGNAADMSEVVRLLDIDGLLSRHPATLSGGEAQRVAIARAICQSPRLVLMDEPLSAVDESRKDRLLPYLDRVRDELRLPIIYVSHDIDEVCRFCDHLVVLDNGQVVASGDLQTVLSRTDLPQLGGANTGVVIDATVASYDAGFDLTTLNVDGAQVYVPGQVSGEQVRLRIAANDVSLVREQPIATSVLNVFAARVSEVEPEGAATALIRLAVGNATLLSRITRKSVHDLGIAPGDELYAQVKSVTIRR
ncbi:MAG: molybdenum ABC transporter ATP-binding protein [Pseudomonadota bacterium]